GSWFTAYTPNGTSREPNCAVGSDPDRCFWVGNVGWMLIALGELRDSGGYTNSAPLANAIARGGAWTAGLQGRVALDPAPVTQGLEGNVSAYFCPRPARPGAQASRPASAVPRRRRHAANLSTTSKRRALSRQHERFLGRRRLRLVDHDARRRADRLGLLRAKRRSAGALHPAGANSRRASLARHERHDPQRPAAA